MYKLKSASIHKLLDSSNITTFDFDEKFNFIIGKNGCGKTTLINLIAAVLTVDHKRLNNIPFEKIELTLQSIETKKLAKITVSKKGNALLPELNITYTIKTPGKQKEKDYLTNAIELTKSSKNLSFAKMLPGFDTFFFSEAKSDIEELVKVSWLSVHRKSENEHVIDDKKNMPAVDQKLSSLTNNLVRYFSKISKMYEDHIKEFQKQSFLSLITYEGERTLIESAKNIDPEKEKTEISAVFNMLQLKTTEYTEKLKKTYETFSKSRNILIGESKGQLNITQFSSIFNAVKARSLIEYYEELQKKVDKIFYPKNEFLRVVNDLFENRKTISISPRNDLLVTTKNKKEIHLEDLSSGEKQLLIILGEALLQEENPVIYIADEPELSLHITWQEQLIGAIASLNPNAQIVFATHSPDIVGKYSDRVIDMEGLME